MADLAVRKGDYGYYLNFTVQDSDGVAYNLTGYTIKLKVWAAGSPGTLVVDGACPIVNAANGTCRYLVTNTSFAIAGDYVFELELTKTGIVESTKTYSLVVEESG